MTKQIVTFTLAEAIAQEDNRFWMADERLGPYTEMIRTGLTLLRESVLTITQGHYLAAALIISMQKSATLAFLSFIREHTIQGDANSRQFIECAVLAAYMLAHPDEDVVNVEGEPEAFQDPQKVRTKANKWLDSEQKEISELLREVKKAINESTAHATVYGAHFTFNWEESGPDSPAFVGSFCDLTPNEASKTWLTQLGRLIYMSAELLRRVNEQYGGIVFVEDFAERIDDYAILVDQHREMLKPMVLLPENGA